MNKFDTAVRSLVTIIICSVLLVSCSSHRHRDYSSRHGVTVPERSTDSSISSIKKVAVIKFAEGIPDGNLCPITGFNFAPADVLSGSGETIADHFSAQLSERGFTLVGAEEVNEVTDRIYNGGDFDIALAVSVAKETGADAVIVGYVARYEERVGGNFTADKPASVAFSVAVVSPEDGRIIWKARFDKTQRPFFEDLTDFKSFFQGGMTWQTADEFSGIGVLQVMDKSPLTSADR